MKILFQSYNNFHDSPEKKAYWEECKLLKKPWIVIEVGSAGRFRKANVRYDFMTADYDLSLEAVALIEQKMAQLWGNQLEKMTTKKSKLTFSHCGKTSGEFSYLDFSEAKKFAEWLEPILYNTNNHISIKESMRQDSETPKVYGVSTISELLNKKKLSPSEKEYALFSALCEISPEKWDKQILLENGLFGRASQLLKIDESKTLYSTIEEAAFLENVSITRYMKDKISQAIVEIVQDAFKEFKEKGMDELKDEQIEDFIQKYLKREREYKAWSEREDNDLLRLWRHNKFSVKKTARLMQRSQASIINRIDFLERIEIKYLNVPNYYKEIRTKTKESGMK